MATVASLFDSQANADAAVSGLDALGVEEGDIRVLTQNDLAGDEGLIADIADAFNTGSNEVSSRLIRLGVPGEEAEFFSLALDDNAALVVVQTKADRQDRVAALLRRAGGRTAKDR